VAPAEVGQLASAPVIFCRNVFIYFSKEMIGNIVERIAHRMPAGGYLCVGASESLLRLTNDFDLKEIGEAFIYVRKETHGSGAGTT
jgi:chemotaxis protein methyltransferase CheR